MSATGVPSAVNAGTTPLVQWSALLAGAVAASGISFTLVAFGTGIGLAVASASPTWRDSSPALWMLSGLWLVLIALAAFGFGGYIAGRMRAPLRLATGPETEFRDGIHGLIMWGLAVLFTAVIGIAGTVALSPTGSAAISSAAEAAIAPDVDALLRSSRAVPDAGIAYRRGEVSRILLRANSAAGVSSDDRDYLAAVVADRSGMTLPRAAALTERTIGLAAIDLHRARVAAVIESFMICAALLIGAAVAWYSAVEGGRDRERGTLPVWEWRFAARRPATGTRP